jgi:hypothetical protein
MLRSGGGWQRLTRHAAARTHTAKMSHHPSHVLRRTMRGGGEKAETDTHAKELMGP